MSGMTWYFTGVPFAQNLGGTTAVLGEVRQFILPGVDDQHGDFHLLRSSNGVEGDVFSDVVAHVGVSSHLSAGRSLLVRYGFRLAACLTSHQAIGELVIRRPRPPPMPGTCTAAHFTRGS